ncbi:MAG: precorrin-6A synthase (deacetylating) [Pseudomonadota bacterium]
MIEELWLIGIGTGSDKHITLEGVEAIRSAATVLMPRKGEARDDLAHIRETILRNAGFSGRVIDFDYPERDATLPYRERVERWHDEIALRWQTAAEDAESPVALLVWGDPSLYDSTMRIAARLQPAPRVRVVAGITAIQALTAAAKLPLNTLAGSVLVTTGRRLRENGWPDTAESVVVMLDGEATFERLVGKDLHIWWGAYLGSEHEIVIHGPLDDVAEAIIAKRAAARAQHGWIMDTYLLRDSAASV